MPDQPEAGDEILRFLEAAIGQLPVALDGFDLAPGLGQLDHIRVGRGGAGGRTGTVAARLPGRRLLIAGLGVGGSVYAGWLYPGWVYPGCGAGPPNGQPPGWPP
jgi:hypothetical protein